MNQKSSQIKNDNLEIFLPYQKEWLEDRSDLKIIEKSRRCGISWTDAADAVMDAAPAHGWTNTYYMSFNKDNCRQYIEDVGDWAKKLGYACSEVTEKKEILLDDEDKSITTYRITFASGAEIMGLPGVSRSLRSKQGNVVLDEAAFFDDFESVLQAAKALVMWGGRIRVISTHNSEESAFNQLIKKIRSGKESEWSLHRITFREAMKQGLYKRICLTQGKKWTQEADKEFLDKMYRIYGNNPGEELDVIPNPVGGKYFAHSLLSYCEKSDIPIVRLDVKDDFMYRKDGEKDAKIEKFFKIEIAPILNALENQVYFGQDFGRSGDLTTYWINEEASQFSLETRLVIEIKNCPFEQQQYLNDLITDLLDKKHILGGGALDSRGNGQQIAEHAMLRHPGAVLCVMENRAWYARYFADLHGLMESMDFTLPDDEVIQGDFGIVSLRNGVPLIPDVRTADRTKGARHGDAASAAVLSVCAWRECALQPAPNFSFIPKKNIWERDGF